MIKVTVVALAGLVLGAGFVAEPAPNEMEAMQGAWAISSFTVDGEDVDQDTLGTWRRIVDGERITWTQGDQIMVELTIQFDPTQKPKTLDSTIASGDNKGQTLLAIYELNGDELRVCFTASGQQRPTEFSGKAGSNQILYTAKRLKQ